MTKLITNLKILFISIIVIFTISGCGQSVKNTSLTYDNSQLASIETNEELITTINGTIHITKSDFE